MGLEGVVMPLCQYSIAQCYLHDKNVIMPALLSKRFIKVLSTALFEQHLHEKEVDIVFVIDTLHIVPFNLCLQVLILTSRLAETLLG